MYRTDDCKARRVQEGISSLEAEIETEGAKQNVSNYRFPVIHGFSRFGLNNY